MEQIKEFALYQNKIERTRSFDDTELANYTLGLVCEAGEVGDIVKKVLFHGHDLDKEELIKELGDTLWYLGNVCNILDISLQEVAEKNIQKLKERYPFGFDKKDSANRKEYLEENKIVNVCKPYRCDLYCSYLNEKECCCFCYRADDCDEKCQENITGKEYMKCKHFTRL